MTRTRPKALRGSLRSHLSASLAPTITSLALVASGALLLDAPAPARAATVVAAPAAQGDGGPNTYLSSPPELVAGRTAAPAPARPEPPKTRGTITGQVVGPGGTPIPNALVTGVRFSDLGLPVDRTEEKPVLARTNGRGQFSLKQLREPYLVRICSESVSSGGARTEVRAERASEGHRARRSGECDQESSKRFTPTWLGPDGNLPSWMRHTRMYQPVAHRSMGRIVVQPTAVVTGTWKVDGADRTIYLTRIDGSIAAQTQTDAQGQYRFEVAPGPYRVEADRDPGLRTASTVPGFRSHRLLLRAGRTARISFKTRHAGIIRGLVTSNGVPLPDQFLSILDNTGAFAGGVVTNEIGRYVVTSLKPGAYTVATSYAGSAYVPKQQIVAVTEKTVATADLALDPGRSITFSATDTLPGANGSVDAELRNADGRVLKVFQGSPAAQPGGKVTFAGLPAGTYSLSVRRSALPSDGPEQVDFPWGQQTIDLNVATSADLAIPLDQPTVNLSGSLPAGGQVKLTAVPEDPWLRPAFVDGDQATPLALNWTEQETGGQYVVRGLVPGTYTAAVTTARKEREDRPSKTGANLAVTHSAVSVTSAGGTQAFTAPVGAVVRGQLRYSNNRPVIAPLGVRVLDTGDQSWLFPTVSGKQKYGRPFKVERLHSGPATTALLDLVGLFDEHPDVLVPDDLLSSARDEPGTPYWFTAKRERLDLVSGQTEDLGVVSVKLHGVNGVKAVLGGGGRQAP
ncbi:carboxypeptidase regulatory-like domain-containing protein [Nocardioides anomalus]|uniref:Carboxypeptidase regulatory-like domain-containing protein n=1 Tax=Nocardioides anomalus TaxID=2712223 RepID=A0A6G6WA95_9ACTN|nr:carboxypeptidase-like regulatory domain-containing protein [Nocardioides anomalus]QIG42152.1 carboxypeptidase regulatory-like domain-containing protein [Nocardioides anomalus]